MPYPLRGIAECNGCCTLGTLHFFEDMHIGAELSRNVLLGGRTAGILPKRAVSSLSGASRRYFRKVGGGPEGAAR